MTSPYRPTLASGMTGSSVAHGFAGGTPLPMAPADLDEKFQKPASHGTVTGLKANFEKGTHNYTGNGMQNMHVTHPPRM